MSLLGQFWHVPGPRPEKGQNEPPGASFGLFPGLGEKKMRYGARKGSKTRDFSYIWAEMCEKSRVFDTFWRAGRTKHSEGPKTRASRRQKNIKNSMFSLFFGGGAQKSSFYLGKRDFLKIWSFSGRLATPI